MVVLLVKIPLLLTPYVIHCMDATMYNKTSIAVFGECYTKNIIETFLEPIKDVRLEHGLIYYRKDEKIYTYNLEDQTKMTQNELPDASNPVDHIFLEDRGDWDIKTVYGALPIESSVSWVFTFNMTIAWNNNGRISFFIDNGNIYAFNRRDFASAGRIFKMKKIMSEKVIDIAIGNNTEDSVLITSTSLGWQLVYLKKEDKCSEIPCEINRDSTAMLVDIEKIEHNISQLYEKAISQSLNTCRITIDQLKESIHNLKTKLDMLKNNEKKYKRPSKLIPKVEPKFADTNKMFCISSADDKIFHEQLNKLHNDTMEFCDNTVV